MFFAYFKSKTITHAAALCKDFDIQDIHVSGVTTNDAANMVTMTDHLKWSHIHCFTHTLQLGVQAGLK